jgi:hypothetical protein
LFFLFAFHFFFRIVVNQTIFIGINFIIPFFRLKYFFLCYFLIDPAAAG